MMFKVSEKLLYIVLPLFALLKAGVLASDGPGSSQIPLDSAPPPPIPLPIIHHIHPGYTHNDKCVDVKGAAFENGTPVQLCVLVSHSLVTFYFPSIHDWRCLRLLWI